jgi:hypothetical protein
MLDLEQLQLLGQLVDNIEVITGKLEKSFEANNAEEFANSKKGILEFQKKINKLVNTK